MIFSKTILAFLFNHFSFPTSLIIHSLLIMCVINFLNYKINVPINNNKIIELQLLSHSKNKENILQEDIPLVAKKSNDSVINRKDLEISSNIRKRTITNKLSTNNFPESQIKEKEKSNSVDNEKNKEDSKRTTATSEAKISRNEKSQLSEIKEKDDNSFKKLEEYKIYLKNKIQKLASNNYPNISIRKREEGNVEIIFSLDKEGLIKEVIVGKNTNASERIIASLTNVLKNKIVKFQKNEILKKINTFSINIVYKLR